ncbi:hypothetical protein BRE01_64280 [Brevibacillus reuszeri]|uniref:N-acetylmuramoyl-L-alanine amidase n=1 Tax=Brevibacillus reuszeri TaxID=54915 RepID=A0ABQ0TXU1_9BACL|nr:phosphodiester glycosidase family protein [Brevibacillus reuszeri]MED1861716.1 phosphodiester glycosidase family protein [Brevibacillus reuszeri]GED72726.1 hypothetical protein BRE01_64280 [Brevibacillus reuszeri]
MYRKTDNYIVFELDQNHIIDYQVELGKSISQIATNDKDVVFRQNATFAFKENDIYKPIGNIVKEGKLNQTMSSTSKWSAFIVPKNGKPYVGVLNPNDISNVKLGFQSTPQIVKNGQVFINSKEEATPSDVANSSTQRSAIGIKANGAIVLVTTLTSFTLNELAKLMINLGCVESLNLDGGGSTSSNYMNEKIVKNERPVSAAIVVRQKQDNGDGNVSTPLIIIDAGHGGIDSGAENKALGLKEKELTLQISLYQYARFQQLNVPVALTRNKDETLDSTPRTKRVKDSGAKYCISNHINAGGGKGVETIHSIYADGKLAKKLYDAIISCGQLGRRVFTRTLPDNPKRDYYYMHRDTGSVDTTIVEYGFIDNAEDVVQVQKNWQVYAESVVKAFCEYTGVKYTPPISTGENELQNALKVIQEQGAINTPDYWIKNAVKNGQVNGEYAALLIQNVAKVINQLQTEIITLKNNQGSNPPLTPKPEPKPDPTTPTEPKPIEQPKTWDQVLKLATDTSVYFQVGGKNGTGVLLKDGYILTAKHVIHPDVNMKVQTYDRTWYDITFISQHPDYDIALCKITDYKPTTPFVELSNRGIKTNQKLIGVGHGLNVKWRSKEGVVCNDSLPTEKWKFDCSLPFDSDDSGTATLDEYGQVTGIAVQRVSVGIKVGSVSQVTQDSAIINIKDQKVQSWLKENKIIK